MRLIKRNQPQGPGIFKDGSVQSYAWYFYMHLNVRKFPFLFILVLDHVLSLLPQLIMIAHH